jgi:hypothetical protein
MKQTRRIVLTGLVAMIFARLFPEMLVRGQESESVDIQWRVPRKQVKEVREQLNFNGKITGDPSTIEDSRGLPLIYIFVGIVTLGQLAKTLLEVYRDVRYGGIVVRSENGKLQIENDPRFSSGTIIVQQKDKVEVTFREKDNPSPSDLIKVLEPFLKK